MSDSAYREIEIEKLKEMYAKYTDLNEWVEDLVNTTQCENKNGRDS